MSVKDFGEVIKFIKYAAREFVFSRGQTTANNGTTE